MFKTDHTKEGGFIHLQCNFHKNLKFPWGYVSSKNLAYKYLSYPRNYFIKTNKTAVNIYNHC
jgi:hypothetical protein